MLLRVLRARPLATAARAATRRRALASAPPPPPSDREVEQHLGALSRELREAHGAGRYDDALQLATLLQTAACGSARPRGVKTGTT